VVGSGPDAVRLKRLAARLGVTDRIEYLGHVPQARLFESMHGEADVLLFPSMREDAGWVVAEAGLCGLPVVALDRGPSAPGCRGGHTGTVG
jgi:glycosyltransferase involved in cell wall biosynthesis